MAEILLRKPKTVEELRRAQLELFAISRPFVELKCDILAISLPTMLRHPNGLIQTIYPPEVTAQLAEVDRLWDEAQQSFMRKFWEGVTYDQPR